jgi:hypothetical protein
MTLGRIPQRGQYPLTAARLDLAVSAYREMTRVSHEAEIDRAGFRPPAVFWCARFAP